MIYFNEIDNEKNNNEDSELENIVEENQKISFSEEKRQEINPTTEISQEKNDLEVKQEDFLIFNLKYINTKLLDNVQVNFNILRIIYWFEFWSIVCF